jgi:uncharacterized protein DUF4410
MMYRIQSRASTGMLIVALLSAATAAEVQDKPTRVVKDGILDQIELFLASPPAAEAIVVIHPFTTDKADLGTGATGNKNQQAEAATMQTEAPKILSAAFVKHLESAKVVRAVRSEGDGDLVVDGSFTEINPGSRAKRYFGGFGAGKSSMAVEGTITDGTGKLLARFKQRRIATMGVMGGDSLGKMKADSENLGEDLAKFIRAWLTGKKLD